MDREKALNSSFESFLKTQENYDFKAAGNRELIKQRQRAKEKLEIRDKPEINELSRTMADARNKGSFISRLAKPKASLNVVNSSFMVQNFYNYLGVSIESKS